MKILSDNAVTKADLDRLEAALSEQKKKTFVGFMLVGIIDLLAVVAVLVAIHPW